MRTTAKQREQARIIRRAATALAARARAERGGELSLNQTAVLGRIVTQGPITPGEVADQLRMLPQSLTRTFAALEAAGYVRRMADPEDGRQSLLVVTAAGRIAINAEMVPRDRWLARAMAAVLTEDERESLTARGGADVPPGRVRLRRRDGRSMTSVVETAELQADAPDSVPLRRIAGLFAAYRWQVLALVGVSAAQALANVASPFLMREIIDRALPERSAVLVSWFAGGMLVAAAVAAALGVTCTWLANLIGQQVMHDLRVGVYTHLQRMSLRFFTRARAGELQSRIANDVGGVDNVVSSTASSIVQNVFAAVTVGVAALIMEWKLALICLLVVPAFLLFSLRLGRKRRSLTRGRQKRLAGITGLVEESLSVAGVMLTKTLGSRARAHGAVHRRVAGARQQRTGHRRCRGDGCCRAGERR